MKEIEASVQSLLARVW